MFAVVLALFWPGPKDQGSPPESQTAATAPADDDDAGQSAAPSLTSPEKAETPPVAAQVKPAEPATPAAEPQPAATSEAPPAATPAEPAKPVETAKSDEPAKPAETPVAAAPAAPKPEQQAAVEPQVQVKERAPDPAAAVPEGLRPSFDVVRIAHDCLAVFAGRAEPGAGVVVSAGDAELGRTTADGRGEWVLVPVAPLAGGSRELSLTSQVAGKPPVDSDKVVVVVVPDCAEHKPTPATKGAIAVLTPKSDGGESKVLQPPQVAPAAGSNQKLALGSVDYDDKGTMVLKGKAEPKTAVQAYVGDKPVGTAVATKKGEWKITPEQKIEPGVHKLRIDQVAEGGKVTRRIELPLSRAKPGEVTLMAGQVIVQPGNSLWRIARKTYGEGIKYVTIYAANAGNIRDPDLIYPGQVFNLPKPAE